MTARVPVNNPMRNLFTPTEIERIASFYERDDAPHFGQLLSDQDVQELRNFVFDVCQSEIDRAIFEGRLKEVIYVDEQPYRSADHMRKQVGKSGILYISNQFNTDPILGEQHNLLFRTAHDLHHIRSNACNFELDGEICAYAKFAAYTEMPFIRNFLFSEIVAQVCYFVVHNDYSSQEHIACIPPVYRMHVDENYGIL